MPARPRTDRAADCRTSTAGADPFGRDVRWCNEPPWVDHVERDAGYTRLCGRRSESVAAGAGGSTAGPEAAVIAGIFNGREFDDSLRPSVLAYAEIRSRESSDELAPAVQHSDRHLDVADLGSKRRRLRRRTLSAQRHARAHDTREARRSQSSAIVHEIRTWRVDSPAIHCRLRQESARTSP